MGCSAKPYPPIMTRIFRIIKGLSRRKAYLQPLATATHAFATAAAAAAHTHASAQHTHVPSMHATATHAAAPLTLPPRSPPPLLTRPVSMPRRSGCECRGLRRICRLIRHMCVCAWCLLRGSCLMPHAPCPCRSQCGQHQHSWLMTHDSKTKP